MEVKVLLYELNVERRFIFWKAWVLVSAYRQTTLPEANLLLNNNNNNNNNNNK
jgi:hypothetical protein